MMDNVYTTLDSGARAKFEGGAVRDLGDGKGRFDLLPTLAFIRLIENEDKDGESHRDADPLRLLVKVHKATSGDQSRDWLALAVVEALRLMDPSPFLSVQRVAQLYERGAVKYAARNWEIGIPVARMFSSAIRHAYQGNAEVNDGEDHFAAVAFNLLGVMEYEERADRWDTPRYSDLFVDLGDLYYRNNPKRIISGAKLMQTPSVEGAVKTGVEQGKIRLEGVTLSNGKVVMLPKPEDVVEEMERRINARNARDITGGA